VHKACTGFLVHFYVDTKPKENIDKFLIIGLIYDFKLEYFILFDFFLEFNYFIIILFGISLFSESGFCNILSLTPGNFTHDHGYIHVLLLLLQ
jgi:hypothetical protein